MKILHLINNLGSGGAEKLLDDLVPLLSKEDDIEADILLLTDKNNVFYDSLIQKGVRVDIIKYNNMYDPRNIIEIKKYIISRDYDVVHSHIFPTQYWVALSRLFILNKDIKFVTTEHSTHNRRREKKYFRYIDKFIYAQYDLTISITEKTRDNLLHWIEPRRKSTNKHIIIENGVDLEKINNALPYKKGDLIDGINDDTKLVCMVGRFSEAKDQPTLIKAISKLSQEVHLILVGEGPLIQENKNLVNKLGISERVHFLGFRHDVPRILKTVDIVVLSSNWEGFGLAVVEGMAAGKPVIASDVDGLREVVNDVGLLFPSKAYMELSRQIISLFKLKVYNEYKTRSMSKAEYYNINRTVAMYTKVYSNLFY